MRCVPVYIVVDVGGAAGQQIVDFVGSLIDSLFFSIAVDPMLDERLFLSVWEFADEVSVLTPLVHTTDVAEIPQLRAGGESGYSTMFRRLKEHIDADVTRLQMQGLPVFRPLVLLFTTGKPYDTDWRTEHRLLVGEQNPFHPNLIVLGPPGSRTDVLFEMASKGFAFLWGSSEPQRLSGELDEFFKDAAGLVFKRSGFDSVQIYFPSLIRVEDDG